MIHGSRPRSAAPPRPSSVATWRGGHYHRTTATTAQPLSPALVARRAFRFSVSVNGHTVSRRPTGVISLLPYVPLRIQRNYTCATCLPDWPTCSHRLSPVSDTPTPPTTHGGQLELTAARPCAAAVGTGNERRARRQNKRAESEDPRGSNAPNGLCCARAEEIWGRSAAPQQTLDGNKLLGLPGRRARVLNWGSGGRRLRHPPVSVFYSRDGAPPRSRPETGGRAGAVGWHRDGAEIHPDSALSCSALLVSNPSFAWMGLFEERV